MSNPPLVLLPIPRKRKGPNLKDWQTLSPESLAKLIAQNPGCNLGIRHDFTAAIDPDSKEAGDLCDSWEAEGKLPKTVAWKTAAGNIKRLFKRPAGLNGPLTIKKLNLQLRTGPGLQDVIPNSYVKDPAKGIDGYYEWLPGQSPEDIRLAELPQGIIDFFIALSGNGNGPPSSKIELSKADLLPPDENAGGHYRAYAQKALADELATLAGTPEKSRNDQLNKSAFALGQLVAAGILDRGTVEAALAGVAASIGLTPTEIRATIRSGTEAGMKEPRVLPERKRKERATPGGEVTAHEGDPGATLPRIMTSGRLLHDISNEVIGYLESANNPPFIFRRMGTLARISIDERESPKIDTLTDVKLRGICARNMAFFQRTRKGIIPTAPPVEVMKDILALGEWSFPALQGIVRSPVMRPDGTILIEPGYDPITHLYYAKPADLSMAAIPERPTDSDVEGYLEFILEPFRDFPFVEASDRANALAFLFSLPVRPAILGSVPMAAITKPTPGTGASLFVDIVANIVTGKDAPMAGVPGDDDEMRKFITSRLIAGDPLVSFDNLELPLGGPSLSRVLTCHEWEDRVLGQSVTVRLPQRSIWVANGNNLKLQGDLPRRTFPICFDAKIVKPWERENFRHPDLRAWVRRRRGDLLAAILAIARAWFIAGKPEPQIPVPVLGSFEEWANTIGGILAFAGVEGFLENSAQFHDMASIDDPEWTSFITAWAEIIGNTPKTSQEIAAIIRENSGFASTLPEDLKDILKNPVKSFERSLGRALASKERRPYGENSLAIQRHKISRTKVVFWKVAPLLRGVSPMVQEGLI